MLTEGRAGARKVAVITGTGTAPQGEARRKRPRATGSGSGAGASPREGRRRLREQRRCQRVLPTEVRQQLMRAAVKRKEMGSGEYEEFCVQPESVENPDPSFVWQRRSSHQRMGFLSVPCSSLRDSPFHSCIAVVRPTCFASCSMLIRWRSAFLPGIQVCCMQSRGCVCYL